MTSSPELSVVIVNWNGGEGLLTCIGSVYEAAGGLNPEVWLVDNASSDGSADRAADAYPHLRLLRNDDNLGFARAANQAIAQARGEFVLLLNPDASLEAKALAAMVGVMRSNGEVGIAGCPSVDGQGGWAPGYERSYPGRRGSPVRPRAATSSSSAMEVAWVSGACLLARKAMVEEIGLLDPEFFMYYEDVDWCYRARQRGWQVVTLYGELVSHQLGGAAGGVPEEQTARRVTASRLRFFRKHYSRPRAGWLTAGLLASALAKWLLWLVFSPFAAGARRSRRLHGARLSAALMAARGRR